MEQTETTTAVELAGKRDNFLVFSGAANFEAAQRMSKVLAASKIVPDAYHNNLPDCVIALEMANRIGASPLAVMQNLYIVHGRPAWSSQFLIACINASGRFSPLRYVLSAEEPEESVEYTYTTYAGGQKQTHKGSLKTRNRSCFAWATDKTGERLEGPPVSIRMAIQEGWLTKDGSKWKTMPELMLRYRAANLFARLFAPELTMGIQTDDEVIDITPVVTEPAAPKASLFEGKTAPAKETPAATPAKAQTLAEALKDAPVTEDDIRAYYRAKNQAFYEKNVLESLPHIIANVLDWKDIEAEAAKKKGELI